MTIQQTKERIDYIDIAKAVGITLVVMRHCGVSIGVFAMFHMPLFFIISGMFFREGIEFCKMVKNKLNKLLIPWGFFYLLGCLFFYIVAVVKPELKENYYGFLDVFVHRATFNYPIWYLLCLFWFFLLYYMISKIPSYFTKTSVVLVLSLCGCLLGQKHIFLPCYFDTALSALFFFHVGYMLYTKTKVFSLNKKLKIDVSEIIILTAITLLGYYYINPKIWLADNLINPICYVFSTTGALALILISKFIKNWQWLTYIGRHSIIILCWHNFFQRTFEFMFNYLSINSFTNGGGFCTMCLSIVMIPISLKLIPWFVGKTDIIK